MSGTIGAILIYAGVMSAITFVAFGLDKLKARLDRRRISERTLFKLCLIGGTPGGGLGMIVFRHKVSKVSFRRTFFGIAAVQIVLLAGWWYFSVRGLP